MRLYGVFVGIDEYEDTTIQSLSYAVHDAEQMRNIFEHSLSPHERELYLLTNEQATRRGFLRLIGEELASKVSWDDIVVMFFAGHGSPELTIKGDQAARYLATYDTEKSHIFSTGINLETELVGLFQRLDAKLIVLLADTCFSGAVGGRTFEGPRLRLYREKMRAPLSLKSFSLGEGRIMIGACGDNELASESSQLGHGVFTYFLIYALTDPNNPIDGIGVTRLYETVASKVRNYTNGLQTPVLNGRSVLAKLPLLELKS